MPYKFETDHVPMPRDKDRRVKLTDEQRKEIRMSDWSSRKLAEFYSEIEQKRLRDQREYRFRKVEEFFRNKTQ